MSGQSKLFQIEHFLYISQPTITTTATTSTSNSSSRNNQRDLEAIEWWTSQIEKLLLIIDWQ